MEWESRRLESLIRSWRGRGLETEWFVEIVMLGLKVRCIAQFSVLRTGFLLVYVSRAKLKAICTITELHMQSFYDIMSSYITFKS
jgi:hypothetical protein